MKVFAGLILAGLISGAAPTVTVDLRRVDEDRFEVTLIEGAEPLAWAGTRLAGGDINGDGIDDLVIAAPGGSEDRPSRRGRLHVIYGSVAPRPAIIDLSLRRLPRVEPGRPPTFTSDADVVVNGWDDFDHLGRSLAVADLDGDGFSEIIASSPRADGPSNLRPDCGEVAIIFGAGSLPGMIDLGRPAPGPRVQLVLGRAPGDTLGASLAAGDTNGDSIPDLVLGAPLADGVAGALGALDVGEVIVIPGGQELPAIVDLADRRLSGLFTVLTGSDPGDQAGSAVALGDFDNDGLDDLAVGARGADGPDNQRPDAGEIYLLSGTRRLPRALSLGTSSTAVIAGRDIGDLAGGSLAFGDLDGDDRADLAIGVELADGYRNGRLDAGEILLLPGRPRPMLELLRPPPREPDDAGILSPRAGDDPPRETQGPILIDPARPSGGTVVTLHGADPGDHTGVRAAVDLDGDARDDLLIGAEDSAGHRNSRAGAGELHVLFGRPGAGRERAFPGGGAPEDAAIHGPTGGAHLGKDAVALDLDGDGRLELIFSAPQAGRSLSGKVWILGAKRGDLLRPLENRK